MIAGRRLSSAELVAACLARIEAREVELRAWAFLDPERAIEAARERDAELARGRGARPLHGVPVGIKDVIDTKDMPTENGYRGHAGRRPAEDAACVRALRDAGAVILGKTVTTELANRTPGPTRNPVNPAHTPGGSSSGSAAAVRAGMVPAALGTQTAGSVIRPASYCGVHGFKPSFGLVSRAGMTLQSDELDTIGAFGRSVEDLGLVVDAMTGADPRDPSLARMATVAPPHRPRLAFVRTPVWERGERTMRDAVEGFAASLGEDCEEVALEPGLAEAWAWQRTVQLHGMGRHYGPLMDADGELMSARLRGLVADGRAIPEAAFREAVEAREGAYAEVEPVFARFDAILTPAAPGPAPEGLESTGEAVFNALWTYLGTPAVSLPLLEADGLPLGVQLVGPRGADGPLLR
ncbi:MAG: amidase, partial [Myxococcota bacterium]|nr:amidase [Myxococcota bacterium]